MLIALRKSTGELVPDAGGAFYGQSRPADTVPVLSSVPVSVRFYDDDNNRALLDRATGVLTFTTMPEAGDTFTIGSTTYIATATVPSAPANEVLLGVTRAQFIANLVGAINGATTGGQVAGTNYSLGTITNPLAYATAIAGNKIVITAWLADASGNSVATSTTSTHASFGAATLAGGQTLNLDIKPQGAYDAGFTLPSPTFAAPLDPTTGDYTGTLLTNTLEAIALLEPNNPATGVLTFSSQPAPNGTITIGSTTYTAKVALTGAANEVLLGASLAAFVANLIGAINAATAGGQSAGSTYGVGTVANAMASATVGPAAGTSVKLTATAAGSETGVTTTTTASGSSFSAAALTTPASAVVEPDDEPLMAQLSWGIPGALPTRSGKWVIELDNSIRHNGEGVPTSANGPLTPSVVQNAVNEAAALTAAVAAAPIRPFAAYLAVLARFFNFAVGLDLSDRTDITHIDPSLIVANAQMQLDYAAAGNINLGTNPLDQATVDGGLSGLAALSYPAGGTIIFGGAVPTGTVAHQDASYKLDFNAVNIAAIKAGGVPVHFTLLTTNGDTDYVLDPTLSSTSSDTAFCLAGLSDITTIAQLMQQVDYNNFGGTPGGNYAFTNNGDETATYPDYNDYMVPYSGGYFTDHGTGIVFTVLVTGVQSAPTASVQTLLNDGVNVTTSL